MQQNGMKQIKELSINGIQMPEMIILGKCLKNHFSSQSKQIQWQVELTNIKQRIGENIEDYAKRFKQIMRKVNYVNPLVDGVQVNYFIKGLNPMYIKQVMMVNPANLNAA